MHLKIGIRITVILSVNLVIISQSHSGSSSLKPKKGIIFKKLNIIQTPRPSLIFGTTIATGFLPVWSMVSMNNVISLNALREIRRTQKADPSYQAYKAKIQKMNKLELLDEMMNFQEERSKIGHLTPSMMILGQILFQALETQAETQELQTLTRSYRRHLKYELEEYLKFQNPLPKKIQAIQDSP